MVGAYRDNREALEARSAELDRALAALPKKRRNRLPVLLIGLGLLFFSLTQLAASLTAAAPAYTEVKRFRRALERASQPSTQIVSATRKLQARLVTGNFFGVEPDALCEVEIAPPCAATVRCGRLLYHGNGSCTGDSYADPADVSLDGTPRCLVDVANGHVLIADGDLYAHLELL